MKKIFVLILLLFGLSAVYADFGSGRYERIIYNGHLQWRLAGSSITTINNAEEWELIAGTSTLIFAEKFDKYGENAGMVCLSHVPMLYMLYFTCCIGTNQATPTIGKANVFLNGNDVSNMRTTYLSVQNKTANLALATEIYLSYGDYIEAKLTSDDGADLFICNADMVVKSIN